jgi:hypothetical protein
MFNVTLLAQWLRQPINKVSAQLLALLATTFPQKYAKTNNISRTTQTKAYSILLPIFAIIKRIINIKPTTQYK